MKILPLALCFGVASFLVSASEPDGIYADFNTSLGSFTASLDYNAAPQTVANFIGLAEGSRAWIDEATGRVWTGKPFYNGITFHRILTGFMNQCGSPNGLGTDGPGYSFKDETGNGLSHDTAYKLSMANSGPHTNGSQFFITVEPTPWLDGKHTVFGQITSGFSVVDDINNTPNTGGNEGRPLVTRIINSVSIRRVGAAAAAFNIHAQNLPECHVPGGRMAVVPNVGATWQLDRPRPSGSISKTYRSPDLSSWTPLTENYRGPDLPGILAHQLDDASLPKAFYHLSCVTYPDALGPSSLAGRTMTAKLFGETQTFTFVFNETGATGNGSYFDGENTLPFTSTLIYAAPAPHHAVWIIHTSLYGYLRLRCVLDSENINAVIGRHDFDQFSESYDIFGRPIWNPVTSGTLTVTK